MLQQVNWTNSLPIKVSSGPCDAVKAGGMRITQNKPPAQDEPEPMTSAEKEEFPEEKPEKPGAVVLSGYRTKVGRENSRECRNFSTVGRQRFSGRSGSCVALEASTAARQEASQ